MILTELSLSANYILANYNRAEDKKDAIKILAELNNVDRKIIIDILRLLGVENPERRSKRHYRGKKEYTLRVKKPEDEKRQRGRPKK